MAQNVVFSSIRRNLGQFSLKPPNIQFDSREKVSYNGKNNGV
jgi:hypothetical protein